MVRQVDGNLFCEQDTGEVETEFELPETAVKEAIVNAVCHRDYTSNASVQVMLFKDRLEIINPGKLPPGWTVENLFKTHKSDPPNKILARPMYLAGYVEKTGSGTRDIVSKCLEKGLAAPGRAMIKTATKFVVKKSGRFGKIVAPRESMWRQSSKAMFRASMTHCGTLSASVA